MRYISELVRAVNLVSPRSTSFTARFLGASRFWLADYSPRRTQRGTAASDLLEGFIVNGQCPCLRMSSGFFRSFSTACKALTLISGREKSALFRSLSHNPKKRRGAQCVLKCGTARKAYLTPFQIAMANQACKMDGQRERGS